MRELECTERNGRAYWEASFKQLALSQKARRQGITVAKCLPLEGQTCCVSLGCLPRELRGLAKHSCAPNERGHELVGPVEALR